MDNKNVSIIIPAYDEEESIGGLIEEIKALYPEFEIIVINDGSSDNTAQVAKETGALVYSHPYNIGNGAAIKSGIRFASGKLLVFMDGDGQHDPEEIGKMLEYFPDYDMVVGARPKGHQASWGRALGNWAYNRLASYVAKFPVEDLTSGFRAVKSDIAHGFLYLLPNTYSYPTTLTVGILRSGGSVKYLPIKAEKRRKGNSKIKIFQDGIRFFLIITKICALYSPLRIFLPISFVMFCLGLGYYLYTFFAWGRFTNMSALLFTTSILIFMMGLISEQICQMRFERSEGDKFI
ncbi:MAG: glycosyltransferase family 2 protein [Deltaproteobacteria bacterium]|nr:MAG: glycosyltransferase family 2 protein [Deltaproteobacteria bacterium]